MPPSTPREALPAHRKVILLGTCLVLACVIMASIGMWSSATTLQHRLQLTERLGPAFTLLLQISRTEVQAELCIERAAGEPEAAPRNGDLVEYEARAASARQQFGLYRSQLGDVTMEAAVAKYDVDRNAWVQAADKLRDAIVAEVGVAVPGGAGLAGRNRPAQAGPRLASLRERYAAILSDTDEIVERVYRPAIASVNGQAALSARLAVPGDARRCRGHRGWPAA